MSRRAPPEANAGGNNWVRPLDLPPLEHRSAAALLFDRGRQLAIALGRRLTIHRLRSGNGSGQTESRDDIRLDGTVIGMAAAGAHGLLVTHRNKRKTVVELIGTGRQRNRIAVPEATRAAMAFGDCLAVEVAATESSPPRLQVLEITTGKLRRHVDLPSDATHISRGRDPGRLVLSDRTLARVWIIDSEAFAAYGIGEGFSGQAAIDFRGGVVIAEPSGAVRRIEAGIQSPLVVQLEFPPAELHAAGDGLVAVGRDHRRMVLLHGATLQALLSQRFGFRGATILTDPDSELILWFDWSRAIWEAFDTRRFLEEAVRGPGALPPPEGDAEVSFIGAAAAPLLDGHAPTIGPLRTLVLPLLEAGQTVLPGDVARLHSFLHAEVFPVLTRYYGETSYGLLTTRFDMLGVEFRAGDQPLLLPRPFADYFHGDAAPGGFRTTVEGFVDPHEVIFSGSEALRLHVVDPDFTSSAGVDVDVPFAALSLTRTFVADPTLSFGGEEITLVITEPATAQRLVFVATSIAISSADPAPGLRRLRDYLTSVLAAVTLADESLRLTPQVRRVPTGAGGFGELHVDFVFSGTSGRRRIVLNWLGDLPALDFGGARNGWFRFGPGGVFDDEMPLQQALARALLHGQVDANLGDASARPLADPQVTFFTSSLELETVLSLEGLSAGRALSLVTQTGLESLGFDGERPIGTRRISTLVRIDRLYPLAFEGNEAAAVEISPAGGATPLTVELRCHGISGVTGLPLRPETVTFDGSEEAAVTVTDDAGSGRLVQVTFPPSSFPLRAADLRGDLLALETFIDSRIALGERSAGLTDRLVRFRLAEIALGGAPRLISFLSYRNRSALPARGIDLSVISDASLALFSLGFRAMQSYSEDLYAIATHDELESYLERVVGLAAFDAGRAADDPLFARPEITIDAPRNRLEVTFPLTGRSAGRRASARVLSQMGLERIGFDRPASIIGAVIAVDDRFTVRQFVRGGAVPGDEDAPVLGDEIISALFDRVPDAEGPVLRDRIHADYDVVMPLILGPAPSTIGGRAVPADQRWTTSEISVDDAIREFASLEATVRDLRGPAENQVTRTFFLATILGDRYLATMAHEMGHVIGFYDLYQLATHRDNLHYLERWSIMGDQTAFPHVDGFHKEAAGWLDDDPDPTPLEGVTEEMLLIAHDRWDATLADLARSAFGRDDLDVRPLLRCTLGGDAAQTLLIEARQRGIEFSQGLPADGRVLVMNAIDHEDTNRYPIGSGYRRHLHLLGVLDAGASVDLGTLEDLAVGGTTVSVLGRREIPSPAGPVIAFQVQVVRERAEHIDLYFHGTTPPWRSSDLWIDHPAGERTIHPVGAAIEQGDVVRVPASGVEPHDVVARVWNGGSVEARNVRIRFLVCTPAGAGDRGNFVEFDSRTVTAVPPDRENPDGTLVVGTWDVAAGAGGHQCLIAELADWSLPPREPGAPAVRDDFVTSNHAAQQNVTRFEALHGSPFEPIEFDFSVANSGLRDERARLQPEGLPQGMRLTVNPAGHTLAPGDVKLFHCRLELDGQVLKVGASYDRHFLLVARRDARVTEERWGAVKYVIQPRQRTTIAAAAGWSYGPLWVTGEVLPHPFGRTVRLRLIIAGQPVQWQVVPMRTGHFEWRTTPPPPDRAGDGAQVTVYYDGDPIYASAMSAEIDVPYVALI